MENQDLKIKIQNFFLRIRGWFFEVFIPEEDNKYLPKGLRPRCLFLYGAALILVKIGIISFFLIWPNFNSFSAITQQQLLSLINEARAKNGLSQVALNSQLTEAASFKLEDMFAGGYFEHTSPTGVTPWFWFKKAGYNYEYAGENLAINFSQTEDVFNAWMQSPAHRENILNANFKEIGLAVKSSKMQNQDTTLAVLVFGRQPKTVVASKTAQQKAVSSPIAQPAKASVAQAAPSVKKTTPTPSLAPSVSASPMLASRTEVLPAEKTLLENIELKQDKIIEPESSLTVQVAEVKNLEATALTVNEKNSRVLGTFVSKADEATKSFYLYFALFLTLALAVNVVVKMEIQHWSAILSAIFIIFISCLLVFI